MRWMRPPLTFIASAGFFATLAVAQPPEKAPIDQLIPWLLHEDHELRAIPFSQVIFDTTGKRVLAVDPKNETDQRVIKQISGVLDEVWIAQTAITADEAALARYCPL